MNYKNALLKPGIILLLIFLLVKSYAQQSRIDSAISLLNKSKTTKGLDTATFMSARQLIGTAVLSEAQINQIEKVSKQFQRGDDVDLCYAVNFAVLISLSNTDKFKAIEYGKRNIKKLERSSTPHSNYFVYAFLNQLRLPYRNSSQLTEGFQFYAERLNQFKRANDSIGLATCYYVLGGFYRFMGLYEPAMYNMKKAISFLDSSNLNRQLYLDVLVQSGKLGWLNHSGLIVDYYVQMGQYEKAISQGEWVFRKLVDYYNTNGNRPVSGGINLFFGVRHLALAKILNNQLDSVDYYLKLAENAYPNTTDKSYQALTLQYRSLYDIKRGAYQEADSLLQLCWRLVNQYQVPVSPSSGIIEPHYYLALLRIEQKRYIEAIALLLKNIERIRAMRLNVLRDYKILASLYDKTGEPLKAKEVYKSFIILQDSILATQGQYRTISFETEQQINENEIAISKLESANKLSAQSRNFTIGIAVLLLVLAGSIYYRFRSKKKANEVLENTLSELKSTQAQLIQSEKMASLGELTAGIAHEIQNPLNFVNNFSEVSEEMIVEAEGSRQEAGEDSPLVTELLSDVKANLQKINHHGKRADAIVKGMLQHSRTTSGNRELTNVNVLVDEYVKLSFHAFRGKDNTFDVKLQTEFDPAAGTIELAPQEMGRVLLNILNNAFYAVNDRKKKDPLHAPEVIVHTKKTVKAIEISVKDNGGGIPEKILDKIFQPFFTTKPTGQGTGLGLSLAYDIVKAHGGIIEVASTENDGTLFTITLP
jgi:two-component system, NtrC family, sensor kinase